MYSARQQPKKRKGWLWWMGVLFGAVLVASLVVGYAVVRWYNANLEPVSSSTEAIEFTVVEGATARSVAAQLEESGLIRSSRAYSLYARFNESANRVLVGDYEFSQSMSVAEIAALLSEGENTFTSVTMLPGQRIDQIRDSLIEAGYSATDVATALDPTQHLGHPALAAKPLTANLEGYVYPETYNVGPATTAKEIVSLALDETAKQFTAQITQDLQTDHGLGLHEAVILASIVEREVANSEDRAKVAQVFVTRYKSDISLGSDPTALYGALIEGIEPSVTADTPYNTRLYAGLPPGPINNVSGESLSAVAYPADTDYIFFVSGDDGVTYFSRTLAEHEALTAQHCIELCRSY